MYIRTQRALAVGVSVVRRINMSVNHVIAENEAKQDRYEQLNLFDMIEFDEKKVDKEKLQKEKDIQKAVLDIKKKFGKNAILKGMSLQEGATAIDRNNQIGGHKA